MRGDGEGKSDAPCSLARNEGSDKASCALGWLLSETHAVVKS